MPLNHVPGLRQLSIKTDPNYERFVKEYYATRGKTNLLTDTTIEQLNSSLPDGTVLYTGKPSRTPFKNDGTSMEYYDVPLATLPIETRLTNEPRKEKTNMDLVKIEEQRRLDNKPKQNLKTFQQFFQPEVRQQKNLQMEISNEYNKRQQAQQEFNNQKNKQSIVHEELLNTINQNKYKQERKQEIENLDNIKKRKREKFIKDIPKLDILAKTTPTLGLKGAPIKEDKKLREKAISQVQAERLFSLKRNQPLLTDEMDNIRRSKKSFTKSVKQQERKKR